MASGYGEVIFDAIAIAVIFGNFLAPLLDHMLRPRIFGQISHSRAAPPPLGKLLQRIRPMSKLSRIQDTPIQIWVNNPTITGFLESAHCWQSLRAASSAAHAHSAPRWYALPRGDCLRVAVGYSSPACFLGRCHHELLHHDTGPTDGSLVLSAGANSAFICTSSPVISPCWSSCRPIVTALASPLRSRMPRDWPSLSGKPHRLFDAPGTPDQQNAVRQCSATCASVVRSNRLSESNRNFNIRRVRSGAFILLGLLIAICRFNMRVPEAYYHRDEQPVERARITGRLKSDRDSSLENR